MGYIRSVRLHRIAVSHRTTWFVTEVTTEDGTTGLGECSDLKRKDLAEPVLAAIAPVLAAHLPDGDLTDLDERLTDSLGPADDPAERFTRRMVVGSVMGALADIAARHQNVPLWEWLGGTGRETVPVYANINRAPVERRSDEFAAAAVAAVTAGFPRIKLAPFDGPALPGTTLLETGLAHMAAVRDAIGPGPTVYIDVHHRLDRTELPTAIEAMEEHGIAWIEDAVDVRSAADLAWLREATSIPLAGGEQLTDPSDVAAVADEGFLSYLLLDPKYVGGPLRFRSLLDVVHDVTITFHDPTSPVSTAVSGHLATLPADIAHIECAFGEAIDRSIVTDPAERIVGGELTITSGPGVGIGLRTGGLGDRCTTTEWMP